MAARYRNSDSRTASPTGTATFLFQAPPPGIAVTGSLGIPGAPSGAASTVTVGGITWGAWAGNATFGPVQQFAAELITVVTTGLSPNAVYNLGFIGVAEDEQAAQIIWPSALATALTTTSINVSTFHGGSISTLASQNVADGGVYNAVALAKVDFDSDTYTTTASKLIVPTSLAGKYIVVYQISWINGGTATNYISFTVGVNGVKLAKSQMLLRPPELYLTNRQARSSSAIISLIAGDAVELFAANLTGATISIDGPSSDTSLSIGLLGT